MFVNMVEFTPVKRGKDKEFKEWFEWSNTVYERFDGFISRRLLKPTRVKGNYVAIAEHETEEIFVTMHLSDDREKAWAEVEPLLQGSPAPHFYRVIISSEKWKFS